MKILGIIMLILFIIFMMFGNVTVNGYRDYSISRRLIAAIAFAVIFGLILGLPILGIIALITL